MEKKRLPKCSVHTAKIPMQKRVKGIRCIKITEKWTSSIFSWHFTLYSDFICRSEPASRMGLKEQQINFQSRRREMHWNVKCHTHTQIKLRERAHAFESHTHTHTLLFCIKMLMYLNCAMRAHTRKEWRRTEECMYNSCKHKVFIYPNCVLELTSMQQRQWLEYYYYYCYCTTHEKMTGKRNKAGKQLKRTNPSNQQKRQKKVKTKTEKKC